MSNDSLVSQISSFKMKDLIESGVHFGHKTMRWNPKMASYLYGSRDGIHIIDLQQTVPLLHRALNVVYEVIKNNGRVLFVGTKRQASPIVAEAAKRCGQYYVNHRWLGGMLTNWDTISKSIKTLKDLKQYLAEVEQMDENVARLTKKEKLELSRRIAKLELSLGGITEMGGCPDMLFVIDTNKEMLAIKEAAKLGIPVIAILDSNSDPDGIDYPVPGNDDATRSIKLYCKLVSDAALAGIQQSLKESGVDLGAVDNIVLNNNMVISEFLDNEVAQKDDEKQPDADEEPINKVEELKPAAKKKETSVKEDKSVKKATSTSSKKTAVKKSE